jgi:plasmid stabilization system protein ParE
MPTVLYSRSGRTSLRQAFAWLITHDPDPELAYSTRTIARILSDLERIAANSLYGIKFQGHETRRYWLIADKKYRVYYDRLGEDRIKVVLVRSVKQQPVSGPTLEKYFSMPPLK